MVLKPPVPLFTQAPINKTCPLQGNRAVLASHRASLSFGKLREIKVFYLLPDYTLSKMKAWGGKKKALCSSVKLAKRVRIKML